jgi:hypothetical protein
MNCRRIIWAGLPGTQSAHQHRQAMVQLPDGLGVLRNGLGKLHIFLMLLREDLFEQLRIIWKVCHVHVWRGM